MLSGRGLLTSTGEAGALAVVAFKEQTSNQDMIRGPLPNNTVHINQWPTKVNKPPSEHVKLLSHSTVSLHNRHTRKTLHHLFRLFLAFSKFAEEAFVFFLFLVFIFSRRDCSWKKSKHHKIRLARIWRLCWYQSDCYVQRKYLHELARLDTQGKQVVVQRKLQARETLIG